MRPREIKCRDSLDYGLVYAVFGFSKGQIYPLSLPDDVRTLPHWMRRQALHALLTRHEHTDRLAMHVDEFNTDPLHRAERLYNWGEILLDALMRIEDPSERLDLLVSLSDRLGRIAARTTDEKMATIEAAGDCPDGQTDLLKIEEAKLRFEIETLGDAGVGFVREPKTTREFRKTCADRAEFFAKAFGPAALGYELGGMPGAAWGLGTGLALLGVDGYRMVIPRRWVHRLQFGIDKRLNLLTFKDKWGIRL